MIPRGFHTREGNIRPTRVEDFTYVAPLKIFEEVLPGHEYVIGGDVAEGLKTGDYSVASCRYYNNEDSS